MNYDVQIGNSISRGISYAELVALPIEPDTFVRRNNGDWMLAKDCIELTHILARRPVASSSYFPSMPISDIIDSEDEYIEEEIEDFIDEEETDNASIAEPYYSPCYTIPHNPEPSNSAAQSFIQQEEEEEEEEEERIFIPTAEYFKCRQKRKAAIIGVCTLGLAGLSLIGIGNTWRSNIFAGTSFSKHEGMAFVFKSLSFLLLTALIAIPYFIYSFFALIYYSIRLNKLKR